MARANQPPIARGQTWTERSSGRDGVVLAYAMTFGVATVRMVEHVKGTRRERNIWCGTLWDKWTLKSQPEATP